MKSLTLLSFFGAFAGLASAWTTATEGPIGNPISRPGLHEPVPVLKPYTITWEPTLDPTGTVTLVLMKGPSTNIQPMYAIVEKTPNSGTYVWTPDASFPDSIEGYGIQLIVDSTGQYQWSTQFGFKNPGVVEGPSSSLTETETVSPSTTKTGYPTETTETAATTETTETTETTKTTETTETTTTTTEPEKEATTSSTTEATTEEPSSAVYPNTTITSSIPVTTFTTITEEPVSTEEPTTLTTKTLTSSKANSTTQTPPPPTQTGAATKSTLSSAMALVAFAVVGFSMF